MEIIGYIASLIIGVSLGLIGGGGSILTVPVLVYLFHIDPVLATAYSLFIVGATSLVGVFPKYRDGMVNMKTAIIFGIPSIISVYATRKWVIPAIPEEIFTIGSFIFTKPLVIMLLFALLMAAASISMIRDKKTVMDKDVVLEQQFNYPLIMLEGMLVGALTGLVGAGGGFLIIPALVILSKLPMKQAVGTSLLIIAMKSLFGFLGDMSHTVMDWKLLLSVTALAIIGLFIGNSFNRKINPNSLKKGFGWFVLVMGIYIIIKELFFK
jgi:uncharacterized membrane protein YfcA